MGGVLKEWVKMRVSEGVAEVEFGGMELDWKAVARLQPCCVNRFSIDACGNAWSENLGTHITIIPQNAWVSKTSF